MSLFTDFYSRKYNPDDYKDDKELMEELDLKSFFRIKYNENTIKTIIRTIGKCESEGCKNAGRFGDYEGLNCGICGKPLDFYRVLEGGKLEKYEKPEKVEKIKSKRTTRAKRYIKMKDPNFHTRRLVDYHSGMSDTELGEKWGIKTTGASCWRERQNLPPIYNVRYIEKQKRLNDVLEGYSRKELAEMWGVNMKNVWGWLNYNEEKIETERKKREAEK